MNSSCASCCRRLAFSLSQLVVCLILPDSHPHDLSACSCCCMLLADPLSSFQLSPSNFSCTLLLVSSCWHREGLDWIVWRARSYGLRVLLVLTSFTRATGQWSGWQSRFTLPTLWFTCTSHSCRCGLPWLTVFFRAANGPTGGFCVIGLVRCRADAWWCSTVCALDTAGRHGGGFLEG